MQDKLDRAIYHLLWAADIINSQSAFSQLCGRSRGWFSCNQARGRVITPDALQNLLFSLHHIADLQVSWIARRQIELVLVQIQRMVAHRFDRSTDLLP